MTKKIEKWIDIRENFNGTIIIGNGASMAISQKFSYKSLRENITKSEESTNDTQKLFDFYNTSDFEAILRIVWQANNINKILEIEDKKTQATYLKIRDCLIKAIRNVHPEHSEVSKHFPKTYNFLKNFDTIISLNYDLILYWTIMHGQGINDGHEFKDCFIHGIFDNNWRRFKTPIFEQKTVSLVFYPHGNLTLYRNKDEEEKKFLQKNTGLLESVLSAWKSGKYVPLFVSEGTEKQKINSIQGSRYLSTIYHEVLPAPKYDITIYEWAIGKQDIHILKRLYDPLLNRVAVSVYGNDQDYCQRIHNIITRHMKHKIDIIFFDAQSEGCWNQ